MQERLNVTPDIELVSWPSPQDYNEAVQNPALNFSDPELKAGQPELSPLGLPRPITGQFASVYRIRCAGKDWAVRCFLQNHPDQRQRYNLIARHLNNRKLDSILAFEHQDRGIQVGNNWYPILKMQWCEGENLNTYIGRNRYNGRALSKLADSFHQLVADLSKNDITHGDLQHGNIIVENEKLKLVDYDGMYVPSLASYKSHEVGHPSYKHPGRTEKHYGPYLDNFPAWLIYLSLRTIACAPNLWLRFDGGDECILLSQADLEEPATSKAFYDMERHPNQEVRRNSKLIRYLLSLPVEDVPFPEFDAPFPVPDDLPRVNPAARQSTVVLDYENEDAYGYNNDGSVLILPPKHRKKRKNRHVAMQPLPGQANLPNWMQKGQTSGAAGSQAAGGQQSGAATGQLMRVVLFNLLSGRSPYYGTTYSQQTAMTGVIALLLVSMVFISMFGGALITMVSHRNTMSDKLVKITETIKPRTKVTYNALSESNLLTTGNMDMAKGKDEEARKNYLDVIAVFHEEENAVAYQNMAAAYNNLGILDAKKGKYDSAELYFLDSISNWQLAQKTHKGDYTLGGQALAEFNMGIMYKMQGDYKPALKRFEDARGLYFRAARASKDQTSQSTALQKCNKQISAVTRLIHQRK